MATRKVHRTKMTKEDLYEIQFSPGLEERRADAVRAWTAIKTANTFDQWVRIGNHLVQAKQDIMRHHGLNDDRKQLYREAMHLFLERDGLHDIDPSARSYLYKVMANLPAIMAWRETVSEEVRREVNHPQKVYSRWQSSLREPSTDRRTDPKDEAIEKLNAELEEAQKTIAEMAAQERMPPQTQEQVDMAALRARVTQAEREADDERRAAQAARDQIGDIQLREREKVAVAEGEAHRLHERIKEVEAERDALLARIAETERRTVEKKPAKSKFAYKKEYEEGQWAVYSRERRPGKPVWTAIEYHGLEADADAALERLEAQQAGQAVQADRVDEPAAGKAAAENPADDAMELRDLAAEGV